MAVRNRWRMRSGPKIVAFCWKETKKQQRQRPGPRSLWFPFFWPLSYFVLQRLNVGKWITDSMAILAIPWKLLFVKRKQNPRKSPLNIIKPYSTILNHHMSPAFSQQPPNAANAPCKLQFSLQVLGQQAEQRHLQEPILRGYGGYRWLIFFDDFATEWVEEFRCVLHGKEFSNWRLGMIRI